MKFWVLQVLLGMELQERREREMLNEAASLRRCRRVIETNQVRSLEAESLSGMPGIRVWIKQAWAG